MKHEVRPGKKREQRENGLMKALPEEIKQIIRRGGRVCFAREMRFPKTETSEIGSNQILGEFMEEED